MKYILRKDQKRRLKYAQYESQRKIEKFLFRAMASRASSLSRCRAVSTFCFLSRAKQHNRNFTQVTQRCVLTGRSRGASRFCGISRVTLRELFGFGVLPGYKKAAW